jgi:Zn-dependent protease
MAVLQLLSVLLNLLPIPPLDGFRIVEPFLKPSTREKLLAPAISLYGVIGIYLAFRYVPGFAKAFFGIVETTFGLLDIPTWIPFTCYRLTFFSS